ncbi:hypothetical protein BVH03_19190 [Pseudomonas sp. PA15(2017)]|nr:hypothetical protein BVH03_19190 [Pseudomonas sp. PA15(2017)]
MDADRDERKLPVLGHGEDVRILFFTVLLSLLADGAWLTDRQLMIAQSMQHSMWHYAVRYTADFTMIAQSFKQFLVELSVV